MQRKAENNIQLDWVNSAPTYPQTGHNSRATGFDWEFSMEAI